MPDREDRFADLGAPPSTPPEDVLRPGEEGLSAAERLALRDAEEPPPEPPAPARPGGRYSWVVGVAFLIVIVVAAVNGLRTEGPGAYGVRPGAALPVFAAPLATGTLDGDANVRQGEGGSDSAGSRPACDVRGPGVANLCELRRRPLVITFFFTRAADCEPQLDRVERMRREFPQVAFLGVATRESRERIGRLVRARGWGFPVAVDPDGAVGNLYGVGVCPTTTFAHAGGRVQRTDIGELGEARLRARVRALLRGERR